jgi:hypothetical protein
MKERTKDGRKERNKVRNKETGKSKKGRLSINILCFPETKTLL